MPHLLCACYNYSAHFPSRPLRNGCLLRIAAELQQYAAHLLEALERLRSDNVTVALVEAEDDLLAYRFAEGVCARVVR